MVGLVDEAKEETPPPTQLAAFSEVQSLPHSDR